jgi:hypothetical protein
MNRKELMRDFCLLHFGEGSCIHNLTTSQRLEVDWVNMGVTDEYITKNKAVWNRKPSMATWVSNCEMSKHDMYLSRASPGKRDYWLHGLLVPRTSLSVRNAADALVAMQSLRYITSKWTMSRLADQPVLLKST